MVSDVGFVNLVLFVMNLEIDWEFVILVNGCLIRWWNQMMGCLFLSLILQLWFWFSISKFVSFWLNCCMLIVVSALSLKDCELLQWEFDKFLIELFLLFVGYKSSFFLGFSFSWRLEIVDFVLQVLWLGLIVFLQIGDAKLAWFVFRVSRKHN